MKRMKKILALLLVAVMLLSIAACGKSSDTPSQGGNTPAQSGNSNKEDNKNTIKVKDEKPVLKILHSSTSYDMNTTIEAGVISDVTGYKVEYGNLPSSNASQALMLIMADKPKYDLISISRANFNNLKNNGALLPLNDYIDAIAPELWDCIPEAAWAGLSDEKGNVYALPKLYSLDREVASWMTVRMDLVKAAGIEELPTTLDGFYAMLRTLKAYYGNEYIILSGPYVQGSLNQTKMPECLSAAYGIYNDWMVDENGKVIYMTEHKNFKKMISDLQALYNEGIIDVDWATNGYAQVDENMASGRAIITFGSREKIMNVAQALTDAKICTEDDLDFIGALWGEDGTCTVMGTDSYASYTCIPVKNPENAADSIAFIAAKVKNQEIINIGEEGVHFTWGEDGYPHPINPIFTDERNKSSTYLYFADMETYRVQFSARLQKSAIMWRAYSKVTLDTIENNPEIFVTPYFAYTNSSAYAENNEVLLTALNDYLAQVIPGLKSLDDLDTFYSDWKNNLGEEVRAELQVWYDTNYAGQ